jgi:hypothetical protein
MTDPVTVLWVGDDTCDACGRLGAPNVEIKAEAWARRLVLCREDAEVMLVKLFTVLKEQP